MDLYTVLTAIDTLFDDIRYAVLLEHKGCPFSRYVVIPSYSKIQYYGLDLGMLTQRYYRCDISTLLGLCNGHLLTDMPDKFKRSDKWMLFTSQEFYKYNDSLWGKPNANTSSS